MPETSQGLCTETRAWELLYTIRIIAREPARAEQI